MCQCLFIVCAILCGMCLCSAEQCASSVFPPDSQSGCCGLANGSSLKKNTSVAEIDEYPWMALIEYKQKSGIIKLRCSGILISARYVISAAQCFTTHFTTFLSNIPINVRLGEYDTNNEGKDCVEVKPGQKTCNDAAMSIPIEKATPHPDYNRHNRTNDIALIRLARQVQYTDFIRPICLPSLDVTLRPPKNFYMTVTGWGAVNATSSTSNVLRRVHVPFVDMQTCESKYNEAFNRHVTNNQLCAGSWYRDACRGDAGGPLMYFNRNKTELAGIVSFGPTRCGSGIPGVYTKVFAYKDWIHSVIEEDSRIRSSTSTITDSEVIYFRE